MQPGAEFKRGVVSSYGYSIPYAEAGAGDVIVSLPGSAGLELSKAKDALARQFRVIEFDPPGWGENPSLTGDITARQLARIVGEAVIALGIERYTVVGTSLGGLNALYVAQLFPDRVHAIVLEAPMAFYLPENQTNPESEGMVHGIRAGFIPGWDDSYPAPPPHPSKPWATPDLFHEQMRRRFKMFRYFDYSDISDLEAFARMTTIPTTLILGTEDEILKLNYADRLKSIIPHLNVKIVEGATHDVQNTDPQAFIDALHETVTECAA